MCYMSSKSQNTFICWDLSIRSMLDRTMMTEIELTNFIGYIVEGVPGMAFYDSYCET